LGMTFEELREKGPFYPKFEYKKYENGLLRPDGKPGFKTPTEKFELSSTIFEMCGHDPLPSHNEPPESPVSTPELVEEYPLILTTGAKNSLTLSLSPTLRLAKIGRFEIDSSVRLFWKTGV